MKSHLIFLFAGILFISCVKDKKKETISKSSNSAGATSMVKHEEMLKKDSMVSIKTRDGKSSNILKEKLKGYYFDQETENVLADTIHELVIHYLTKVDKDWIASQVNDPHFYYTAESQERGGTEYYAIRLTHELDGMQTTIQWIYIDLKNRKIFEYDLPNDELISFLK